MPLIDLRLALRQFWKSPGLSILAVTALAIGIGLTTAMFSIVDGAILRGLPFEDSDALMQIESYRPSTGARYLVTLHDLADWRDQQTSFEGLGVWMIRPFTVHAEDGGAERYNGGLVSSNLFDLLRVRPYLGRGFEPADELSGSEPVVLLSHDLWSSRFDGDRGVVGKVLRVDGVSRTVVGVMPKDFSFPIREDVWIPADTLELPPVRGEGDRFFAFGRLRPGVTESAARSELNTIARRLAAEHPETNEGLEVVVGPYLNEVIGESLVKLTYGMLAAVLGVLLIACANVANLLLARTALRTKEVAVRLGMGANRGRILLQLLSESFALALLGALLGVVIAKLRIDHFNLALQSASLVPFWLRVSLDRTALFFVLAITLISALAAGCLPAYQASRTPLSEILKSESRTSSSLHLGRLSRSLVIAEIALSCGLLVAAGLMIQTVVALHETDYGFATESVLIGRVELDRDAYPDEPTQRAFFSELRQRLASKPGFDSVALTSYFPALGAGGYRFTLEGEEPEEGQSLPLARGAVVSPEFFGTFGVSLLEGRGFRLSDDENATPVVIVNRSFADRYCPGESPLGRRLRLGAPDGDGPWWTIVGVAPDVAMNRRRPGIGIIEEDGAGFYLPFAQSPQRSMGFAVRTSGSPLALAPTLRETLQAMSPTELLFDVNALDRAIDDNNVYYRLISEAFLTFGLSALILASIGLYGVMSFSVNRRTREIGVRLAMGARARDVVRMVMRQGLTQLAIGVFLGLLISLGLTRVLEVMLFGVEPYDPFVFLSVVVILTATGCLATAFPALRASTVDPVASLRDE